MFVLYLVGCSEELSGELTLLFYDTLYNMIENNLAFIDGQNLHLGTVKCSVCSISKNIDFKDISLSDCTCGKAWAIDNFKFRKYLQDNYFVKEAYFKENYYFNGKFLDTAVYCLLNPSSNKK